MARDEHPLWDVPSASPTRSEHGSSISSRTSFKHASCELPGSVFLITSDGDQLSLPIPSKSPRDPLNWGTMKRARAFISIFLLAIIGMFLVQGPSLMFVPLTMEFSSEVCHEEV